MLTDQQTATIEHRVGRIHARHIADLHAISNAALAKLRPDNKASYGGIFNGLVEDTMAAIRKLEAELSKDIPALARTLKPNLDESDRDQILRVSQRALSAELYEKRLASFKESYSRRMAGYGVVSSLSDHRFDLIEARYTAGTQNAVRRAVAELKNALDSHVYADRSSGLAPLI